MYNDVVRTKGLSQTPNPSALVRRFCLFFCLFVSNVLKKKLEIYKFLGFFATQLLTACPQIEFSSEEKTIWVPPTHLTNVDFEQ